MAVVGRPFVALLVAAALPLLVAGGRPGAAACAGIAVYNVTFEGLWSEHEFPKQYPAYRPAAQWSRIIGRTHAAGFSLFRINENCTPSFRQFAETGHSSQLSRLHTQGRGGVLDVFAMTSVARGVGSSSGILFFNQDHTLVSLASRIIPSPDWFVGVDSLSVCSGNGWLEYISADLSPMDAGTDRGFTFTAPNWRQVPPKAVSQITSHSPSHPAASFFYPDKSNLAPIARVTLSKTTIKIPPLQRQPDPTQPDDTTTVQDAINEPTADKAHSNTPEVAYSQRTSRLKLKEPTPGTRTARFLEDRTFIGGRTRVGVPTPRNGEHGDHQRRKLRKERQKTTRANNGKKHASKQQAISGPGNNVCEVSEWSSWGKCSKTCGYGTRSQTRTVLRQPSKRSKGRPCPQLQKSELCGSMKTCGWKHFQFSSWNSR